MPAPFSALTMADHHDLARRRVSRRGLLQGAALLSAGPVLLRSATADAAAPLGPRWLAYGDDPSTSMTISTSTAGAVGSAQIEYGVDAGFGTTLPLDVRGVTGTATRYGSARLTGLRPGADYVYRVRVDGRAGPTGSFRTAPTAPKSFTFTAFGDEGTTTDSRAVVQGLASHRPDFHLLAGDLCYADDGGHGRPGEVVRPRVWDTWLRLIEPVASQVPWMTAVGNHEMEPGYGPQGYDGYLARFQLPRTGTAATPASYHFRYGSVAFVQLDSNDVSYEIPHNLGYSQGAQDRWLEGVLQACRAPGSGVDFVVATMHHCAYSTARSHGSDRGVRDHWVSLFDRYGVDLVISGHNHSYERTHLMRAGAVVQTALSGSTADSGSGTTYLTVGGGGAPVAPGFYDGSNRVASPSSMTGSTMTGSTATGSTTASAGHTEPADWSARTSSSYCYAVCSVTPAGGDGPAQLRIAAFDARGEEIDSVTLTRRGAANARPAGGGSDLGLYVGGGAGAAVLAAAAGTAVYRVRRRREDGF